MGKFTKNNFLNTFNKIKEFFRHFSQVLCIRLVLHRTMDNLRDGLSQIQSDFTLIETNHPTFDAIAFF
ncbi:hypothetical protein DD793_06170 [Helicobacter pylori]|nr:hypothetical protein DD793_06170 [Helicobacter pylori]